MSYGCNYVNKYSQEKSGWKFATYISWYVRVVRLWSIIFCSVLYILSKINFYFLTLFSLHIWKLSKFTLRFPNISCPQILALGGKMEFRITVCRADVVSSKSETILLWAAAANLLNRKQLKGSEKKCNPDKCCEVFCCYAVFGGMK